MAETHASPDPNPSPVSESQRPGRSFVTIVRVTTRESGFIFARLIDTTGDEPEECLIHKTTVPSKLWDTLERGHVVTCKIQETSKGLRGWDISAGSAVDQRRIDHLQEEQLRVIAEEKKKKREADDTRGNR